jgi:serine/threonine-protein kinase
MSPEQAAGRVDALGPASDVYSLGATLYCVLTGQAPFTDSDMAELLRKVEWGDFPPPRKLKAWIDPALEAICLRAMATDPARRYGTPRALADDVEHWLADEPVSAWREPIRRRMRRWGRRHRLLVTGLAATLFVAVAALAVGNVLVARQRDRAEQNLAFARTVVDEMYTGVADKLEDQKEMDGYQREILEKALAFYERFALPQSRDPQVLLEAARAGLRVGAIRLRLGNIAAAEQADQQALGVLSRLVVDHPADAAYRDALAQAHQDMGEILRDEERGPAAERELKAAAALWEALVRDWPEIAQYLSKLANARVRLGWVYRLGSRVDEARAEVHLALNAAERLARENPEVTAYQDSLADVLYEYARLQEDRNDLAGMEASSERAVAIRETLARDYPEVPRHRRLLGKCLMILGHAYAAERKFPQADEAHKRSLAVLEQLAADHPLDIEIAADLAGSYRMMTDALLLRGDVQSALEWAGRAIPLLRTLARRDPGNLSTSRTALWRTLAERAESFIRLGRHTEALADLEEILELTRPDKHSGLFRAFHVLTKARLGDLSALDLLRDQAREAVRVGAGPEAFNHSFLYCMTYYDAACIHAALAKLALANQGKQQAERQRLAQPDIERSLMLLDQARSGGEFKEMIHLDEVRKERLLDPLRSHPRFQLLMMDLAFPENPFGSP